MSGLAMKIEGLDEFKRAIAEAKRDVRAKAEKAVHRSTLRVQTAAVKRIQRGPKTGRVYERGDTLRGNKPTHQASAPGQPPASDSGRLASSIETYVSGLEGWVFTKVEYAKGLELGTSKIKPRPWLLPSIEEDAPRFRAELMEILQ